MINSELIFSSTGRLCGKCFARGRFAKGFCYEAKNEK